MRYNFCHSFSFLANSGLSLIIKETTQTTSIKINFPVLKWSLHTFYLIIQIVFFIAEVVRDCREGDKTSPTKEKTSASTHPSER